MKRLSKPLDEMSAHYDAIVVGSGYGGGVAASRMARMGLDVAVLERGAELHPGNYPDTAAKAADQLQVSGPAGRVGRSTALFDLHAGPDISVLVGCGLGGTSLINANVSLRPDPRAFTDPRWPNEFADEDLEEGYRRADAMLKPRPYPDDGVRWPHLPKLEALSKAADALGAKLVRPPINVAFEDGPNPAGVFQPACNLCGDCCSGCNVGAKSTTLMNYLPDAVAFKAQVFCGARVRWIERRGDRWCVGFQPQGEGRALFGAPELSVTADTVILAAGPIGSTEILLRSRERGLPLSTKLGSGFSGNGDVLAFSYNNDRPIDGVGVGYRAEGYDWRRSDIGPVGPTITGLVDLRSTEALDDGMVVEEGSIPGGLATLLPGLMAAAAAAVGRDTDSGDLLSERAREVESLIHGAYHGAVANTQTFLVMSHDGAGGTVSLEDDRVAVRWPGVGDRPGFAHVAERMREAARSTGGTYVPDPVWTQMMGHELVTVHPLGGCPMGRDAQAGVVDAQGAVFSGVTGDAVHPGLFVCDGSVMPRSLGVNPLLTIAATAERSMIRLARALGREIDMAPAPLQAAATPEKRTVGIRFTERMAGTVTPVGGGAPSAAAFVVTVEADDLDRFISTRSHEASLTGTVSLPALSNEPLTIHGGSFNLFTDVVENVETKQMEYRAPLATTDGRRFHLHGRKTIHDDRGFDLWRDTTTLRATVSEGETGEGTPLLEGELVIKALDLVRQLRTIAAPGADGLEERLAAVRRFGFFFAGRLFGTYGGSFARPSLYDPTQARTRRPLRVGEPEVHHFPTSDGRILRLTRYRGGGKGPVILSHGLGVSSLIFSIDTIGTNLLEYVYASGYDVWLLDYRASIELGYAREQFTADDVATKDYPAAVEYVRTQTGAPSVQMIAHCYGAMTFAMSMLGGLPGVRAAVISQIAAHADVPLFPQRLLAYLHAPDLMHVAGISVLDARATVHRNATARLIDAGIGHLYPFARDNRTRSVTSRRITALYGQLYQLDRLNQATLDAMPEMFGKANVSAFRHLARIAREGHVVRADGTDDLVSDVALGRFAIPTLFVHGALNRAFAPSGTVRTMAELSRVNGASLYDRVVIPETGHIDTIFGKHAAETVYPAMVRHLDVTARV